MEKKEYEEILAGEDLGNWLCKVSREHPKVARVDIRIIADGDERLTRGFDMQSVRIFPRFLNVRCRPSRKLMEAMVKTVTDRLDDYARMKKDDNQRAMGEVMDMIAGMREMTEAVFIAQGYGRDSARKYWDDILKRASQISGICDREGQK